jgi:hypothetical protein
MLAIRAARSIMGDRARRRGFEIKMWVVMERVDVVWWMSRKSGDVEPVKTGRRRRAVIIERARGMRENILNLRKKGKSVINTMRWVEEDNDGI